MEQELRASRIDRILVGKLILPSSCTKVVLDSSLYYRIKDYNNTLSGVVTLGQYNGSTLVDFVENQNYVSQLICSGNKGLDVIVPNRIFERAYDLQLSDSTASKKCKLTFNKFNENEQSVVSNLNIYGWGETENASELGNLNGLSYLRLTNSGVKDISWIRSLTNLTYLDLNSNGFSDISSLGALEKINMIDENGEEQWFNLSSNSIQNLTPLVNAIGNDEKIEYHYLDLHTNSLSTSAGIDNVELLLKLHKAGLKRVNVSGNSFTTADINALKNGKIYYEEDGVTERINYEGFGDSYVTN